MEKLPKPSTISRIGERDIRDTASWFPPLPKKYTDTATATPIPPSSLYKMEQRAHHVTHIRHGSGRGVLVCVAVMSHHALHRSKKDHGVICVWVASHPFHYLQAFNAPTTINIYIYICICKRPSVIPITLFARYSLVRGIRPRSAWTLSRNAISTALQISLHSDKKNKNNHEHV